jgi:hypothetical protein
MFMPLGVQSHNNMATSKSFESVAMFKLLKTTITGQNDIHEGVRSILYLGKACYYSAQNLLSSRLKYKILKIK